MNNRSFLLKQLKPKRILMLISMIIVIVLALTISMVMLLTKGNAPDLIIQCQSALEQRPINLFSLRGEPARCLAVEAGREYRLIFQNHTDMPAVVSLTTSGAEYKLQGDDADSSAHSIPEISLSNGEEKGVILCAEETGDILISYRLNCGEQTTFWAADCHALSAYAADERLKNSTLYLLNDIETSSCFIFKQPFALDCRSLRLSARQGIYFISEDEGTLNIQNCPESWEGETVYIEAPQWDIQMDRLTKNLLGDEAEYYADARSLNGAECDNTRIPVYSTEQWEQLLDPSRCPLLKSGVMIEFIGDFSLSSENNTYQISKPVSMTFSDNVDLAPAAFSIETYEQGEIHIVSGDHENVAVQIDAPCCSVTWSGKSAPDTTAFFEQMNVSSYNGAKADPRLGGQGQGKITSMEMTEDKDKGLYQDLDWEIDGNILKASYGYTVSENVLKRAKLNVQVTSGKAAFNQEAMNTDGTVDLTKQVYCVVTDENGFCRSYKVRTTPSFYDIPVVYITTENGRHITSKEDYVRGSFSMRTPSDSDFAPVGEKAISIKGRGNSTWNWPKKPYRIKFDHKISLFGLPKAKNWVLLANYADRSLIRNQVAMAMAQPLGRLSYVPAMKPVDLFVNGVYQGVYSLSERIEENDGRVELDVSASEDTGYLLEVGGVESEELGIKKYFHAGTLRFVLVRSPASEVITEHQLGFISDYVAKADQAVAALDHYEDYIDIPSLIDWFLHHELAYNLDSSFRRSCYLTKDKGGKLKMGPPWDFDLAFGNFINDYNRYTSWASVGTDDEDSYVKTTWLNYLLQDPAFTRQLKQRWGEVGNLMLSAALEEIALQRRLLQQSQRENFSVWNIFGENIAFESSETAHITTYDGQLDYIENFLKNRKAWMDQAIASLK
jgi:hypothetical protein